MGDVFFLQDYRDRLHSAKHAAGTTSYQPADSALVLACRAMSDSVQRMRGAAQQIAAAAADLRDLARGEP